MKKSAPPQNPVDPLLRTRRVEPRCETAAADKLADDRADYGQPEAILKPEKILRQSEWDFQHPERLPAGLPNRA